MYIEYIMYNVYIKYKGDNMYKVGDFRNNIRKAFNEADNGREVLIERYGQQYKLSALIGKPGKDGSYAGGNQDMVEDDGRPIKNGDEHTVKFQLPKPKIINSVEAVKELFPKAEVAKPQKTEKIQEPITYKKTSNWGA